MTAISISIVGATGLVGRNFIKIIEKFDIDYSQIYLYASKKSAGKKIMIKNKPYTIMELTKENILKHPSTYALFSAGSSISKDYALFFTKQNTIVIDNSSQFRMDYDVPLIVPEINFDQIENHLLIANPNCSTIQSVLPLKALEKDYSILSVSYTTYQAVSGSGQKGLKDLDLTENHLSPKYYTSPIYNNVIPVIDKVLENNYTFEEEKMILETRKILNKKIDVHATCVRVPVKYSHSVDISVTLDKNVDLNLVLKRLTQFEGLKVILKKDCYPTPRQATNQNFVYVGRIRKDYFKNNVLHLFTTADNIRKGAALNAVQILKKLIERRKQND